MAKSFKGRFHYQRLAGRREIYSVTAERPDGSRVHAGRVEHRWIRHLKMMGWEATATDGTHRAVHNEQWQAAMGLMWDGQNYQTLIHPTRPT